MQPNQPQAVKTGPAIVLTGGGSGGHITPLLSLARELKKRSPACHIIYIGLKGEKLDRLQDEYSVFDEVYYVPSGKFRRYHGESFLTHLLDIKTLLKNARDFFLALAGIFYSRRILKRVSPNVVFSKGGFVAVPVGIAAKTLGLSIVTHDSDTVPGLANRIIGRWAAIHATGMPPEYYDYPKDTIRYTGIPLNQYIVQVDALQQAQYRSELGLPLDKKIIIIAGGGLGAQSLNELVVQMSKELFKNNSSTFIVHFTGTQHAEPVKSLYQQKLAEAEQKNVQVIGFSADFYKYSGSADLIITRAGATTLAELALQAKACIVIPSPFLTGGHQTKNAHHLQELGAVWSLPNNATPHELYKVVDKILKDDAERAKMSEKFHQTAQPDAAGKLADVVLQLAETKTDG